MYAVDRSRVSAFYRATLGLELAESESTHDLLAGRGVEVLVHAIPPEYAASIEIPDPVVPREETPIKSAFLVASLEAVRVAAQRTGGHLLPAERAWRHRGCVVLDGGDPEGNVVQFRQRE